MAIEEIEQQKTEKWLRSVAGCIIGLWVGVYLSISFQDGNKQKKTSRNGKETVQSTMRPQIETE